MIKITAFMVIIATALLVLLSYGNPQAEPLTPSAPLTETTTTTTTSTTTTSTTVLPPVIPPSVDDFMACIRHRESRGDYTAVNPTGTFMGAYQIYQEGWDAYAERAERPDLVGVQPHDAAPRDQDIIALAMYNHLGSKPWGGACQ